MIPQNENIIFVHKTTAVYLLPMKKVYAYHIKKRFISEPFIPVTRKTFLACGNIFLKVQLIHDTQDHISEVCSKLLF